MPDASLRRFTIVSAPHGAAWIGDVLRRIFACPDRLPGSLESLVEHLRRIRP